MAIQKYNGTAQLSDYAKRQRRCKACKKLYTTNVDNKAYCSKRCARSK